jgi:hypothetical protein
MTQFVTNRGSLSVTTKLLKYAYRDGRDASDAIAPALKGHRVKARLCW